MLVGTVCIVTASALPAGPDAQLVQLAALSCNCCSCTDLPQLQSWPTIWLEGLNLDNRESNLCVGNSYKWPDSPLRNWCKSEVAPVSSLEITLPYARGVGPILTSVLEFKFPHR